MKRLKISLRKKLLLRAKILALSIDKIVILKNYFFIIFNVKKLLIIIISLRLRQHFGAQIINNFFVSAKVYNFVFDIVFQKRQEHFD